MTCFQCRSPSRNPFSNATVPVVSDLVELGPHNPARETKPQSLELPRTSTDAGGSSPFYKSELLVFLTFLEIMMALLMVLAGLGLVVAEPSGVVNSTLRGNEPRHLASCGLDGKVDCGVCRCTDRIACEWCDGNGGPARIGSSGPSNSPAPASTHASGSCPSHLVSCGVCTCTTRSACQYCDGYGGPARISVSASHRICGPLAALLAIPLAISLRK